MDSTALIWGFIFGTIGLAYFIYGKKQQRFVAMFCGLGLMIFPYFVSQNVLLILIGVVLSALPFIFKE
jgi:hypothetical protein